MKIDVLLYRDTNNPDGLPVAWPAEVDEVADDAPAPAPPRMRMTKAQYASYIAAQQSKYDAWKAARDQAEQVAAEQERALRESIRSTIADLRSGNGTAAERLQRLERAVAWLAQRELDRAL